MFREDFIGHLFLYTLDLWVEVARNMNVVGSLRTIHSWGVSALEDADTAFWGFFWKLKNKINDDACRKCFPGGSFQCAAVDLGVWLARMLRDWRLVARAIKQGSLGKYHNIRQSFAARNDDSRAQLNL